MDPLPTLRIGAQDGSAVVLRTFGREGERGRRLRSQLAAQFPGRPEDQIEDAVQSACRAFLAEAEGIEEPARIYAWIRTVAHHALLREIEHLGWERATDPVELGHDGSLVEEADPAEELIALEDGAELEVLVREVADSLPERRRNVLALWGAGHNRPEIAARLGVSERVVKRDLLAIMDEARVVLAQEAGNGCLAGEPQVLRLAYGLASMAEATEARLHLEGCRRCSALMERLEAWRAKVGAVLPLPAAGATNTGLIERIVERGAHAIGSVKRQVFGGGAELKQQAAATVSSRTVDPTPLAGLRPGAVAAVVAGCLAAVGGGATYCAQHGVDPLGAAANLIAGTQEGEPSPPPEATESAAAVPPPAPAAEEAPAYQPAEPSQPETTYTPEPKSEPEPEPAPEPEPEPEPEASFEPSAPVTTTAAPSEEVVAEPATESAPTVKAKPAPAPSRDAPQFGGP
jgi:RNA polymerase sigma factor (sigma-70 family)